ncbi:MAG: UvrD-helicase domain-containing protein [Firmicutes bacterium]|nr:UvrD-helicase domain-containing protein [Bacillota bacterium]
MSVTYHPTLFQYLATDYRRNLAVTAGAGTGKTEVLTRRIIKILARERHCLDRLLVLTFTDKAAVEMKERIYNAVEKELARTGDPHFQKIKDTFFNNYISTFHAFCAALLREYPIEAAIDPYFRVLDETDQMFFLTKSVNRALKEMAAAKNNMDIQLLSEEFSRSGLSASIFAIIQKREDAGPWITGFTKLDWEDYRKRIYAYRDNILREIAYKLYHGGGLKSNLQKLESLETPPDSSVLNRKRKELIRLIPLLLSELELSIAAEIDVSKIIELKSEIISAAKLTGGLPPKSWPAETYDALRGIFLSVRYLLDTLDIEGFEIVESHEKQGFEILKALARVTNYCLKSYHKDKAGENYLDFQDLQLKVVQLLEAEKGRHILDEIRHRFLFIMVDEFQDTNDLQWQIIRKIASDQNETIINPKLFVVGDEKQAIYSFRGGDVRLFSRVRQELRAANQNSGRHLYPFDLNPDGLKNYEPEYREKIGDDSAVRAGEIVFADNFRSAAAPVNFFNQFFYDLLYKDIYEEYDAKPQKLVCSGNKSGGSVELLLVDSGGVTGGQSLELNQAEGSPAQSAAENRLSPYFKEALLIADKIKEVFYGDDPKYARVRENARKGRPAVAVLLSRRTMIKTYEEALRMNRIDFTVVRGRGFFQRPEIVDLGNLLAFLTNPADDRSLVGFLRSPAGHVSDEAIFLLTKTQAGANLWEKLIHFQTDGNDLNRLLARRDYDSISKAAVNLRRWLNLSRRMPLVEFLRLIINESGLYVSFGRGARGDQVLSNIEKLIDCAREMSLQENADLADFSAWLNDRIDYVEEEGEADMDISLGGAVQIMTVHQSKGLEFPMVFVPDLGAGFNLGERDSLSLDQVPAEITIDGAQIYRREIVEIGINVANPEKEWEEEPILIKRIIKKRLRDKLIAEKKRLFYVAATRAMDHLVLVGHAGFSSPAVIQRAKYAPLDQLSNWMDWLNKILGLSFQISGLRGEITYGNSAGETISIPYRMFTAEGPLGGWEQECRTEFSI